MPKRANIRADGLLERRSHLGSFTSFRMTTNNVVIPSISTARNPYGGVPLGRWSVERISESGILGLESNPGIRSRARLTERAVSEGNEIARGLVCVNS